MLFFTNAYITHSCTHMNIICIYFSHSIFLHKVPDVEMCDDDNLLDDQDVKAVPSTIEIPNNFGRNLIRRLGIALCNDGDEAAGSSINSINSTHASHTKTY